jgi:superfamily II DNA/RNA helicase
MTTTGRTRGHGGGRSGKGRGGSGGRGRGARPAAALAADPALELHPVDTPPDIQSFTEWPLSPEVQSAIAGMGITSPTPIQALAIGPVLEGRDVIAKAETGTGKTLAFGAPMVSKVDPSRRAVLGLVLCPTRELAQQVAGVVEELGRAKGLKVALLVGGDPIPPQIRTLQSGTQIVVGTPGRVLDLMGQRFLSFPWTEFVVLDEADEMLEIGFLDDVEKILLQTPEERQTLLFSATFPPALLTLARKHTRNPVELATARGVATTSNIRQSVVFAGSDDDRTDLLRTIIRRSSSDDLMLVFCDRRTDVDKTMRRLERLPEGVKALHGGYDQASRFRVMSAFREGSVRALLATDVASRGLDVRGVTHVINCGVPREVSTYTHRIGRTGRAGRQGHAITIVAPAEQRRWRELVQHMNWEVEELEPGQFVRLFGSDERPERGDERDRRERPEHRGARPRDDGRDDGRDGPRGERRDERAADPRGERAASRDASTSRRSAEERRAPRRGEAFEDEPRDAGTRRDAEPRPPARSASARGDGARRDGARTRGEPRGSDEHTPTRSEPAARERDRDARGRREPEGRSGGAGGAERVDRGDRAGRAERSERSERPPRRQRTEERDAERDAAGRRPEAATSDEAPQRTERRRERQGRASAEPAAAGRSREASRGRGAERDAPHTEDAPRQRSARGEREDEPRGRANGRDAERPARSAASRHGERAPRPEEDDDVRVERLPGTRRPQDLVEAPRMAQRRERRLPEATGRVEQPARRSAPEEPQRSSRSERGERDERGERPARTRDEAPRGRREPGATRSDGPTRPVRAESATRTERRDRGDRPPRADGGEGVERTEVPARPHRPERAPRPEREGPPEGAVRTERSGRTERPPRSDDGERAVRAPAASGRGAPAEPRRRERAHAPERSRADETGPARGERAPSAGTGRRSPRGDRSDVEPSGGFGSGLD